MSHFHLVIFPSIYPSASFQEKSSSFSFSYKNLQITGEELQLGSNEKKKIWAIFSGTLLNQNELTEEIKKLGFHFRTHSIPEMLALGYDAWKEKLFVKLNGFFSLVIFDEEKEICFAIRDHLGHKPLYWSANEQHIFLSTHLQPILASGLIPQTPALDGMASYLYFGFIPQDFSSVEKINKLLPGHYLKMTLNRTWEVIPYWSLSNFYAKNSSYSEEECIEKLGHFLEKSILSLYGKKTALLSSSSFGDRSLSYMASHLLPKKNLFLIDVDFKKKTSQTDLFTKNCLIDAKQIFASLPEMVWKLEEPLAQPESVYHFFQSKKAQELDCNTLLSSVGFEQILLGDQNFASEKIIFESWIHKMATSRFRKSIVSICSLLYPKMEYEILRNVEIDTRLITYLDSVALFKGKNRKKASPILYAHFHPEIFLQRFHQLSKVDDRFKPLLYFDCKTLLPDSLFFQNEKLFTSLEIAYPFTQKDFVEFFVQIPDSIKFKNETPGYLLHKLFEKTSSYDLAESSFSHLFYQRMHQEPITKRMFSLLLNSRLVEEGYISASWIKEALAYPHMVPYTFRELWSILILEIWFRLFISQPMKNVNPYLTTEELLISKFHYK